MLGPNSEGKPSVRAVSRKSVWISATLLVLGGGLCLVQLIGMSARSACIAAQTERLIATSYQHVPERAGFAASVDCDRNDNRAGPTGRPY